MYKFRYPPFTEKDITEKKKWRMIRTHRNSLLQHTDGLFLQHIEAGDTNSSKYKKLVDRRQKLRDLPQNFLKADDVVFPTSGI